MSAENDAATLRAGAAKMRESVGPDAWAVPMIADGLEATADALDRGVTDDLDLPEALALARSFLDITEAS